ncbi:hypothetical protein F5Y18DRAFT_425520 [Xylariaceae sp. FL1019]|nr:hypothetical protein F5Y18DRAFT_425520 [Xylariaceae sp. FL1019]
MSANEMDTSAPAHDDLPGPSGQGDNVNTTGGTFKDLLGPDDGFATPITSYNMLNDYNDAYLATKDVNIATPADLPVSDAQRTEYAARLFEAFLYLDPEAVYDKDQAYIGIFGDAAINKEPRFKRHELQIKAWVLLYAIENAAKGECKQPPMHEANFPGYEKLENFCTRFEKIEQMLQHQKKIVNSVMKSGTYQIRLAWSPSSEDTRVKNNANSAAKKKQEYEAGKPKRDNGDDKQSVTKSATKQAATKQAATKQAATKQAATKRRRVSEHHEMPSQPPATLQAERKDGQA